MGGLGCADCRQERAGPRGLPAVALRPISSASANIVRTFARIASPARRLASRPSSIGRNPGPGRASFTERRFSAGPSWPYIASSDISLRSQHAACWGRARRRARPAARGDLEGGPGPARGAWARVPARVWRPASFDPGIPIPTPPLVIMSTAPGGRYAGRGEPAGQPIRVRCTAFLTDAVRCVHACGLGGAEDLRLRVWELPLSDG